MSLYAPFGANRRPAFHCLLIGTFGRVHSMFTPVHWSGAPKGSAVWYAEAGLPT
jgi:hypothetical protein